MNDPMREDTPTKPMLACDGCRREVGYTQQAAAGGSVAHVQLCADCMAMVPALHARIVWATQDHVVKLERIFGDWSRECDAHHGQKPWRPQ